jgi:hypothetical protein
MIHYAPRINHIGYEVHYPACGPKAPNPPQFNPLQFNVKSQL